jgi:signal peptide peptidase SppA
LTLFDIMTAPWAIMSEGLQELREVYETHLKGDFIDIKGLESRIGIQLSSRPADGLENIGGMAVIPIEGVLTKRHNLFSLLFGGTSMEEVGKAFTAAMSDPDVKSILLKIDSGGGSVDGTFELAETIFNARGTKPILAFTDGTMASAAAAIGTAADKVLISSEAVRTGSIGILRTHVETRAAEISRGMVVRQISGGDKKAIGSPSDTIAKAAEVSMQADVDTLHELLIGTIAKHRGMSPEQVTEAMGDARVFIGSQAIEAGLVDGVSTFQALVNGNADGVSGAPSVTFSASVDGDSTAQSDSQEDVSMKDDVKSAVDKKELKEKHPDLYADVLAEGKAVGMTEGRAEGMKASSAEVEKEAHDAGFAAGAAAETERVKGVMAVPALGQTTLVSEAVLDGKTTAAELALKIVAAEGVTKEARAKEIANSDPEGAPAGDDPGNGESVSAEQLEVRRQMGMGGEVKEKVEV